MAHFLLGWGTQYIRVKTNQEIKLNQNIMGGVKWLSRLDLYHITTLSPVWLSARKSVENKL